MHINKHMELLGKIAKDCVTGIEGVIESVNFDLYGCVQASVRPAGLNDKGEPRPSYWYDVSRLQIVQHDPVMTRPLYEWGASETPQAIAAGQHGAADKAPYGQRG